MSLSLSLSSFSILGAAATFVLLGACTNPVILATGGSGGSGPTSSSSSTGTGTGAGTTTGTGGGNACTAVGGTCEFTGDACNGAHGEGAEAAACGPAVGAFCCVPAPSCDHPCPVENLGQTQCAGNDIETCTVVGSCSVWVITSACGLDRACDSLGTKCITTFTSTCTPGDDVQCGCGCGADGMIECTGGIPPTCNVDGDCGPTCSGFVCSAHQCVPWICNPGSDEMCNDAAGMSALAGSCNADGTCACKTGFTRQADGKCG